MLTHQINKRVVAATFLGLFIALPLTQANAKPGKGGHPGPPPPEAIEACADKNVDDACSFTGRHGEVEGVCETPRNGDESLVCAPENGPDRPPKEDQTDNLRTAFLAE